MKKANWKAFYAAHEALNKFKAKYDHSKNPDRYDLYIPDTKMSKYRSLLEEAANCSRAVRPFVEKNISVFTKGLILLETEERNSEAA
jgi:hypothetical protein